MEVLDCERSDKTNQGDETSDNGPAISNQTNKSQDIKIYKTRFWVLGIFALLTVADVSEIFFVALWGTFGPIMDSAKYAFGWSDGYIALLDAWGPINSVLFMVPLSYINQKYGLRVGVVLILILFAFGSGVRCLSLDDTIFTYLASVGAICVGIASCLSQSLPVMVSATWFPANERTTATAISSLSAQISTSIMYLSPLIVRSPNNQLIRDEIKLDIRTLLLIPVDIILLAKRQYLADPVDLALLQIGFQLIYSYFGFSAVLLICGILYFPSKPATAPSLSATRERTEYFKSIKAVLRNRDSVFVLLTYAYSYGVPIIWISVMNFSLLCLGFSQTDTMYVAIAVGVASIITDLSAARIADRYSGHMKKMVITLLCAATAFFFWFLLMTEGVISHPSKASVYVAVVGGMSVSYAIVPIVIEFAIEVSYPAPESTIGALSIFMLDSNGIVFLLLMMIPTECYRWLSYALLLSVSIPIVLMATVTEKHMRLDVDMNNTS